MNSIRKTTVLVCTILTLASLAPAAMAKNDKHGNGAKSQHGKSDHGKEAKGNDVRIAIANSDREQIRRYLGSHSNCPPGLAKKNNGCLPPGQAKKRYVVGHTLPSSVTYYPVPRDLLVGLGPVPNGYQYIQVDQDVLLISEASHHIIDAVTLLSAVR